MHSHILTIGLSGLNNLQLFEILASQNISVVVDIRQYPVSRQNPAFNRARLSKSFPTKDIQYVYLGSGLGNIPDEILDADINPIAQNANLPHIRAFAHSFHQLISLLHGQDTIAVIGSKENPKECPRFFQLAPLIERLGFFVSHRLANNIIIPNWQLELELPGIIEDERASKKAFAAQLRKAYQNYRRQFASNSQSASIDPSPPEDKPNEEDNPTTKESNYKFAPNQYIPLKTSA